MSSALFHVLYIEDDDADVDFAQMSFAELGVSNLKMHVLSDGETALQFLGIVGNEPNGVRPNLILLDLNIPRVEGKELLKLIKQSPAHKKIPVVVLSTSGYQRYVDDVYTMGASGYFKKPANYAQYKDIFGVVYSYWASKAALPSA